MDEIHFAPPKKPNDDPPVFTNQRCLPMDESTRGYKKIPGPVGSFPSVEEAFGLAGMSFLKHKTRSVLKSPPESYESKTPGSQAQGEPLPRLETNDWKLPLAPARTVDGCEIHKTHCLRNPGMIRFPCKYHSKNGVPMVSKWCRWVFFLIHSSCV